MSERTSDGPAGERRRPTMIDVAALAGVSLSTVSRVVNGQQAVRADLALRVREAVDLLDYRRDLTASTLRRADRTSASVGLVFEDVSNPFFSSIHRGFEEVARARGMLILVGSSDEDPARERELVHGLCERRVDGLVLAPIEHNHAYLLRDLEAGMAVVFIDRPPQGSDADAVLIDNAGAAGHRRIGFLGDREQMYTARERLSGYRDALLRHGLTYHDELVRMGLDKSTRALPAAGDLCGLARPPSALVTSQNFITIGAVHALQALGRQNEIALVGIDDVAMADAIVPRLSVVAQDPLGMGHVAGELLFARLDGAAGPAERIVMPTELLVRGSGEIRAPAEDHRN